MHLPDLIWEEILLYVEPADSKKLLTLNNKLCQYIVRQKSLCLNEEQIEVFNSRFPNRLSRIESAQISSSQQLSALAPSAKLKSLAIIPRYIAIKNFYPLLKFQNLQYIDVSKCTPTLELARVISQLQLKSIYLPSFWNCQDRLSKFLKYLDSLPVIEISVTLEYLDFAAVSLLTLPKLEKLSIEAFYVKAPELVLNISFANLKILDLMVHQKASLPVLLFPNNFPKLDNLSISINFAVVIKDDLFTQDTYHKYYVIGGQTKELCLSHAPRGIPITHLSLNALNINIKTILYSLKLASGLRSLSVSNVNTAHLIQETNIKSFKTANSSLVELSFSATEITVDLLRWMSRSFPSLQRLHLGGKLALDVANEKHNFPCLFQLQIGKAISGLSLIRSLSAPALAFLKTESRLVATDRKKIKKSHPSLNFLLVDACSHCEVITANSRLNIEHYITYEAIKGIHNINTYGLGSQTICNVTSSTYSQLWK